MVKDFHTESLYQEIKPLLLRISPGSFYYLLVRLRPGWNSNALAFLKKEWQTHEHYEVFKYSFLDTYFDQLYKADKLRGQILGVFSLLAVFVACLGLFGLASYTAEQRTKEIGIRKVLGATDFSIVHLLSKDFLKPVLLANFLAWPIAYYEMSRWLQDFSYHIDIGARVFALSGMLAMIIALLTVVYQAVKAARANPVEALRQE